MTHTQEQKEWIKKLHTMLMPGISYPPKPTPHQRSLRYKRGIEYVLEDDGETIFNLHAIPKFSLCSKHVNYTLFKNQSMGGTIIFQYKSSIRNLSRTQTLL